MSSNLKNSSLKEISNKWSILERELERIDIHAFGSDYHSEYTSTRKIAKTKLRRELKRRQSRKDLIENDPEDQNLEQNQNQILRSNLDIKYHNPFVPLFKWALHNGKFAIAKIIHKELAETIGGGINAAIAATILLNYSLKRITSADYTRYELINSEIQYYTNLAVKLIEAAWVRDKEQCKRLLVYASKSWGGYTCIQMCKNNEISDVIQLVAFQSVLDEAWFQNLDPKTSILNFSGGIWHQLSTILSWLMIFMPWLLLFYVVYDVEIILQHSVKDNYIEAKYNFTQSTMNNMLATRKAPHGILNDYFYHDNTGISIWRVVLNICLLVICVMIPPWFATYKQDMSVDEELHSDGLFADQSDFSESEQSELEENEQMRKRKIAEALRLHLTKIKDIQHGKRIELRQKSILNSTSPPRKAPSRSDSKMHSFLSQTTRSSFRERDESVSFWDALGKTIKKQRCKVSVCQIFSKVSVSKLNFVFCHPCSFPRTLYGSLTKQNIIKKFYISPVIIFWEFTLSLVTQLIWFAYFLIYEYCVTPHVVEYLLLIFIIAYLLEELRQFFRSGSNLSSMIYNYLMDIWNIMDLTYVLSFLISFCIRANRASKVGMLWSRVGLISECPAHINLYQFDGDLGDFGHLELCKYLYCWSFFMLALRLLNVFTITHIFGPLSFGEGPIF